MSGEGAGRRGTSRPATRRGNQNLPVSFLLLVGGITFLHAVLRLYRIVFQFDLMRPQELIF